MKVTAPSRAVMIGVAAALALVLFWYQLLWAPQSTAIASAHRKRSTSATALIAAEQRLGHLKRLSTKLVQLDAADAKLVSAIPDHDDLDNFLLSLNADAQASGVVLSTVSLSQPSATGSTAAGAAPVGTLAIPLQLSLSGGYFAVQSFLGLLRDGSRVVVIDTVTLSSAGQDAAKTVGSGEGTPLAGTIAARLFLLKGATPPGALPSAPAPRAGTGALETPINAARNTAAAASANGAATANAANQAGGTP